MEIRNKVFKLILLYELFNIVFSLSVCLPICPYVWLSVCISGIFIWPNCVLPLFFSVGISLFFLSWHSVMHLSTSLTPLSFHYALSLSLSALSPHSLLLLVALTTIKIFWTCFNDIVFFLLCLRILSSIVMQNRINKNCLLNVMAQPVMVNIWVTLTPRYLCYQHFTYVYLSTETSTPQNVGYIRSHKINKNKILSFFSMGFFFLFWSQVVFWKCFLGKLKCILNYT